MSVPASVETDICRQVCDYLGQEPIDSINPPGSPLESLFARNIADCRRTVLRKAVWNFAKAEAQVSLIGTTVASATVVPSAISAITQALVGVITVPGHSFTTGQQVSITGVVGMTQLNGSLYTVTVISSSTISLVSLSSSPVNTVGFGAYVSGGVVTPSQAVPLLANLVSDFTDVYQLPTDFIRFLSCGGTTEIQANDRRLYDIRNGRQLLVSNSEAPSLNVRYIRDVQDISQWDDLARQVLVLTLAVRLAYPVTKDPSVTKQMNALLTAELPDALSIDGQEAPPIAIVNSKLITARRMGTINNDGYYTNFPYGF